MDLLQCEGAFHAFCPKFTPGRGQPGTGDEQEEVGFRTDGILILPILVGSAVDCLSLGGKVVRKMASR